MLDVYLAGGSVPFPAEKRALVEFLQMKDIGVGLLGFGTVGAGVVEGLARNGDILAQRLGVPVVIRAIADLDLDSDRGVAVDRSLLTTDAHAVVRDPAVDVVIELIGGTTIARELVLEAIDNGKPVVTANKALLAEHGAEIFGRARERGVDVFFEASVCGGVPIIRALREGLVADRCQEVLGILNGTCNYILSRMTAEGADFDEVLAEAQAAGYAEADPALDIDGLDTAHKAVILASLAYGFHAGMSDIHVEGIRGISSDDILYASQLGYVVKLLAVIRAVDDGVELRVHPALVPEDHMLASVGGVYNAVMLRTDMAGDTLYYGMGAGRRPTASAVLGDVADAARNLVSGCATRVPGVALGSPPLIRRMDELEACYYLRLALLDRPGVLARITAILGEHGISLASILQQESRAEGSVPVVVVTHRARESELMAALTEIDELDVVGAPSVRLRIERRD